MAAEAMDIDVKMNMALEEIIAKGKAGKPAVQARAKKAAQRKSAKDAVVKGSRIGVAGVKKPKGARFANNNNLQGTRPLAVKVQGMKREATKFGNRRLQAKGKRVYVGDRRKKDNSYVLVKSAVKLPIRQQFQQRSYHEAGLYQPPPIRSQPSHQYRPPPQGQHQRPGSFGWGNSKARGRGPYGQRRPANNNQSYLWR
eukprot:evm.model.scf_55.3 EVM.evm.TU.scf_55.3   scf_55:95090-98321(+)